MNRTVTWIGIWLICFWLGSCLARSLRQAPVWLTDRALWSHAAAIGWPDARARVNAGAAVSDAGEAARATIYWTQAITQAEQDHTRPKTARLIIATASQNLAKQALARGDTGDAGRLIQRAYDLLPELFATVPCAGRGDGC